MSNPNEPTKAQRSLRVSEIEDAKLRVTSDDRLQVEFRIDDLVRRLIPDPGLIAGHCGGCNGCMGCSH